MARFPRWGIVNMPSGYGISGLRAWANKLSELPANKANLLIDLLDNLGIKIKMCRDGSGCMYFKGIYAGKKIYGILNTTSKGDTLVCLLVKYRARSVLVYADRLISNELLDVAIGD